MNKSIFFVWYLLKRPFVNIINKLTKPRFALNTSIFFTLIVLFRNYTFPLIARLKPIWSVEFYALFTITVIIYIWKYSDPRFGESWKEEWNKKYGWIEKA